MYIVFRLHSGKSSALPINVTTSTQSVGGYVRLALQHLIAESHEESEVYIAEAVNM